MDERGERRGGVWNALPWSLRYAGVAAACVLLVVGVAWLVLRLAVLVAPLTMAVVAALVLAALLQPISAVLRRRRVPPALAAFAAIAVMLAVLVLPAVLMWPTVADQAADLPDQLSQGWSRTQEWLVGTFGLSEAQLTAALDRIGDQARSSAPDPVGSAMTVVEFLGAALLALVLIFFLLKDGPAMASWFGDRLPARSRDRWLTAAGNGWQALARYARGTVAVAAVDAIGIGAALFIIGVPLALPLTVLTFLAAFVPILGATVAGIAAVLVALAANGPVDALLVLAAVVVVQQIEGNLLEPLIMGRALRLHPAVVLVAVTAGALTGGVAGAIVAVPLTAVAYQVVRSVSQGRGEPPSDVETAAEPAQEARR
ncbi:AI-2E family transporter [Asanoa sp. WMMD1127]|uniref:AI-2E family transporter n=1 Tax=Asanoa sp. WMMD1127 TaxID=3016107 RepID=UPI002417F868|nr:AI-2E family transporter [Asanoa sp. WMMD1127]MDG4826944.1 AI-2E family transporter [Asanoa sp. WMMD1127]